MTRKLVALLLAMALLSCVLPVAMAEDTGSDWVKEWGDYFDAQTLENKKIVWGDFEPSEKEQGWIDEFCQKYGAEIEYRNTTWESWENQLKTEVASGDTSDVTWHYGLYNFYPQMGLGLWEDITQYVEPFLTAPFISASATSYFKLDGKYYGVSGSSDYDAAVMFYNKTILTDYGCEDPQELYDKGEWTWDAYKAILEACTADTDGDGSVDQWGCQDSGDAEGYAYSNNINFYRRNEDGTVENTMKDPAFIAALDFFYDVYVDKGYIGGDFATGTAAMMFDYWWSLDSFQTIFGEENVGFVPWPKEPNNPEHVAVIANISGEGVPRGAKNPQGAVLLTMWIKYKTAQNPSETLVREEKNDAGEVVREFQYMTEEEYTYYKSFYKQVNGVISACHLWSPFQEIRNNKIPASTALDKVYNLADEWIKSIDNFR